MASQSPIRSEQWQSVDQADQWSAYLQQVAAVPVVREIATRSLRLLALAPGERVLDVGCGTGVFLPLLAEAVGPSGRVVGLDQAPAFVDQARERTLALDMLRVDVGDAYALPYPTIRSTPRIASES